MFQGHRMFNSSKMDCLAGFTTSDFLTGRGSRAAIHTGASFDLSREKGKSVRRRTLRVVMRSREDLAGKNVVVVGLGVSGRAAVKLALARGADVVAVDTNENAQVLEIGASVGNRLRAELGPHKQESFLNASLLVLSPGVPATQPEVAAAIQAGVPAISELGFAAESLPESIKIAAISGTNGKSTVTTFAGQLLHHAGVKTFVGGNLGNPLSEAALQCLAFPADDPPFQAAVVEVSSYQMELPGLFHPKVGVILNLTPDHLDRHKTFENYGLTKSRLFAQMDQSDVAIIPQADAYIRKLTAQSGNKGTRAWLGGLPGVQLDGQARRAFVLVPTTGETAGLYLSALKAIGSHNARNAATAALVALALDLGVGEEGIQDAIPILQPPPHRMEIVHQDKQGVLWVNDSKATNVEAAAVGIRAIVGRKALVLLGGLAKVTATGKLGFEQLVHLLDTHRAVILFGESGEQIEEELRDANVKIPFFRQASMKEAVDFARTLVEPGDVVLLCPACASFDEFRNFEHRGQVFKDLATMSRSQSQ